MNDTALAELRAKAEWATIRGPVSFILLALWVYVVKISSFFSVWSSGFPQSRPNAKLDVLLYFTVLNQIYKSL